MGDDNQTASLWSDPPNYDDVVSFEESPLYQAVVNLDATEIRHLLDLNHCVKEIGQFGQTLLHALIYSLASQPKHSKCWSMCERLRIVYMLTNAGVDVNAKDKSLRTVLQYSVRCKDGPLCEVLLQCGADMFVLEGDIPLYDLIVSPANNSPDDNSYAQAHASSVIQVFEKYQPGLWQAVASDNLTEVRKLINLWCKTDLEQNGKSLLDMAISSKSEGVISLLTAVIPTMRLIHNVMAGDVCGVQQVFGSELKEKIHINLKNLGYHGAPILYFVIQEKNLDMLREFKKHGCNIVAHMSDENDYDMPVLFSALQADIPAYIIKELLPDPKQDRLHLLEQLTYKGKNILQVALEQNVEQEAISFILDQGGANLVSNRDMHNMTPRDWAQTENKMHYVNLIDEHVVRWVIQADRYPGRRETLALCGYEHIADITYQWMDDNSIAVRDISRDVLDFLQGLDMYQEQISELVDAIEANDTESFRDRMFYTQNSPFEKNLSWDGRTKGDGLPLLHRAVLRNARKILSLILWQWEKSGRHGSVDNLRDQNRRTALHYACAMEHTTDMCALLHQYGCSDHSLDKDGHEPLDFTEVQGTPIMAELIKRINLKRYQSSEPNPWEPDTLAEIRRQRTLRYSVMPYNCDPCRFHPVLRSRTLPGFKMLTPIQHVNKKIPHCYSYQAISWHSHEHSSSSSTTTTTTTASPIRKLNFNRLKRSHSNKPLAILDSSNASDRCEQVEDSECEPEDEASVRLLPDSQCPPQRGNGGNRQATVSESSAAGGSEEDQEQHLLPNLHHRADDRNCTFL